MKKTTCESCLHFRQYYVKSLLRFHQINKGHCVKRRVLSNPTFCEQWEDNCKNTECVKKSIKACLNDISKCLMDLTTFLTLKDYTQDDTLDS